MKSKYYILITSIISFLVLFPNVTVISQPPAYDTVEFSIDYYFDQNHDKLDDALIVTIHFPVWTFVHAAPGIPQAELRARLSVINCVLGPTLKYVPVVIAKFYDYQTVLKASRLSAVGAIELDKMVYFTQDVSIKAVKAAPSSWYSPSTAHDLGYYGEGMTVAILDLGIDNEHPSLEGSFVAGADFSKPESIARPRDGSYDPDDIGGHGTGVASVLAGRGDINGDYVGIAPKAGIIDCKMSDLNPAYQRAMAEAMEWCLDNRDTNWGNGHIGIDVISMSALTDTTPGSTLGQLQEQLAEAGIPFVQAAGNDGVQHGTPPADYWWSDNVIIAGGIDDQNSVDRDDDVYWDSATYGPRVSDGDEDPYDELKPDVVAPAVDITVALYSQTSNTEPAGGWHNVSGTSYATPHVSGIVTLMLEANPKIASLAGKNVLETIREILHQTAEARGEPYDPGLSDKYSTRYGYGIVDCYNAVLKALEQEIQNDPPEILSFTVTPAKVPPGGEVNVSVQASDPEGDEIYYELTASGGRVEGSGPEWQWTAPDQEGTYTMKVTVYDRYGGEDSRSVDVIVEDPTTPPPPPVNMPPVINSFIAAKSILEPEESVELEVIAEDPDGDDLEYEYTVTEGWISGSGELVDYTAPMQDSDVSITVNVTDGHGGSAERTLILIVSSPPEPKLPPEVESVKLRPSVVSEGTTDVTVELKVTVKKTSDEINSVYADLSEIGGAGKTQLKFLYPQSDLGDGYYTYSIELDKLSTLEPDEYSIEVTCEDIEGRKATPKSTYLTITEAATFQESEDDDGIKLLDNPNYIGFIVLFIIIILAAIALAARRQNK